MAIPLAPLASFALSKVNPSDVLDAAHRHGHHPVELIEVIRRSPRDQKVVLGLVTAGVVGVIVLLVRKKS